MLTEIAIERIYPNPNNPRKNFGQEAMEELAASIKEVGILEPLLVVEDAGRYRLVAGERRWRAAKLAGLEWNQKLEAIKLLQAWDMDKLQAELLWLLAIGAGEDDVPTRWWMGMEPDQGKAAV